MGAGAAHWDGLGAMAVSEQKATVSSQHFWCSELHNKTTGAGFAGMTDPEKKGANLPQALLTQKWFATSYRSGEPP